MDMENFKLNEDEYLVTKSNMTLFIYHNKHSITLNGFKLFNQLGTLRYILKFPNGKYCKFMSEIGFIGTQIDIIRPAFDRFAETQKYNPDWCFGFVFPINDENLNIEILKPLNTQDLSRFSKLLLEYIDSGDVGKINNITRKKLVYWGDLY